MAASRSRRSHTLRRLFIAGVFALALAVPGLANAAPTGQKFAVVNSAGTLVRGNGASGAIHLSTGTYQVNFVSNQAGCGYIATPGDPGAGAVLEPAIATVATRAGNNKALFIQTFNQSTGALQDEPFQVQTYCGTQYFAVIGSDGSTARGPHVVSSAHLATGAYEVIFDKNVRKCAYSATIGTTSTGSIPSPGQVTVVGRATSVNGVFLQIVDRSGNPLDSSFHLAVNCGSSKLIGVINANGTRARGANVVSSQKLVPTLNDGRYEVIFNRNVSGCSYEANVGLPGSSGSITTPVTITTATRAGNPNGVFIFIHQTNGTTLDEPFHLFVLCPPVVDSASSAASAGDGSQDAATTSPAVAAATVDGSQN
jgi:hypothetical protein